MLKIIQNIRTTSKNCFVLDEVGRHLKSDFDRTGEAGKLFRNNLNFCCKYFCLKLFIFMHVLIHIDLNLKIYLCGVFKEIHHAVLVIKIKNNMYNWWIITNCNDLLKINLQSLCINSSSKFTWFKYLTVYTEKYFCKYMNFIKQNHSLTFYTKLWFSEMV